MRFKQFLTEHLEVIKDCADFLKSTKFYDTGFLYRGTTDVTQKISKHITFEKRIPTDSKSIISKLEDEFFLKEYGHAYRSNHVAFCTRDKQVAQSYGTPFVIVPVGFHSALWSENIHDLYQDVTQMLLNASQKGKIPLKAVNSAKSIDYEPQIKELLDKFLSFGTWEQVMSPEKLGASTSKNEIMIHCDSYYLIDENYFISTILPQVKSNF